MSTTSTTTTNSSSPSPPVVASPTTTPSQTMAVLVQLCICFPGLIANGCLVFVIFRNKRLRSTCCSILILLMAICDCLAEFSLITTPTILYLSGITIPLLNCFYIEAYSTYSQSNVQILMLLIGVDRLLSIICPLIYKNISNEHKWKYIFSLLALPSLANLFMIFNSYLYSITVALRQVFCFPTDFAAPVAISYGFPLGLFYNIGTFLIYSTIWLLFKFRVVTLVQNGVEQRVLHSLYILMLLTFFCWIPLPVLSTFVFPYMNLDFQTQLTITRIVAQPAKLAQALNGVVLYVSSSEYRSAMQREMRWIRKFCFKSSNLVSNNNQNNIVNVVRTPNIALAHSRMPFNNHSNI